VHLVSKEEIKHLVDYFTFS